MASAQRDRKTRADAFDRLMLLKMKRGLTRLWRQRGVRGVHAVLIISLSSASTTRPARHGETPTDKYTARQGFDSTGRIYTLLSTLRHRAAESSAPIGQSTGVESCSRRGAQLQETRVAFTEDVLGRAFGFLSSSPWKERRSFLAVIM